MAPDNRVEERIARALLIDDDPGLISIRDRWKPLGLSLEMLRCHRLETSSTSSVIQIYAKQLRSRDLSRRGITVTGITVTVLDCSNPNTDLFPVTRTH
jgi:hypothetical protein